MESTAVHKAASHTSVLHIGRPGGSVHIHIQQALIGLSVLRDAYLQLGHGDSTQNCLVDSSIHRQFFWIDTCHVQGSLVRHLSQPRVGSFASIGNHVGSQPKRVNDGHVRTELFVNIATESIVCIEHDESFQILRCLFVRAGVDKGRSGGRRFGNGVVFRRGCRLLSAIVEGKGLRRRVGRRRRRRSSAATTGWCRRGRRSRIASRRRRRIVSGEK
mmetsp:Transcript_28/g.50  ORF Transcript_28/g.50 Transcript_28/m.50 type:complete len:216 (+) Transcript_28:752-1399(+)